SALRRESGRAREVHHRQRAKRLVWPGPRRVRARGVCYMIDAEAGPAQSETPHAGPGLPLFYPVPPHGGSAPTSWFDRLRIMWSVRWRLWWTRFRFRLWWIHALKLRVAQLRLKVRLALLNLRHRKKLKP